MQTTPDSDRSDHILGDGMRIVSTQSQNAEALKRILEERGLLRKDTHVRRFHDRIGFAVYEHDGLDEILGGLDFETQIAEESVEEVRKRPRSLREYLEPVLGEKARLIKRGFDVIGHVAIMESSDEGHEEEIARAILALNTNVRSVYLKEGIHEGEYRIQQVRHIAGEDEPFTVHKENGYRLYLDVRETYFSPRVSGERLRIAHLVRAGERVLVLFSGIAPYGICLNKHSPAQEIVCVELNEQAHRYALMNVEKNKATNIRCIQADAREACHTFRDSGEVFDRIIMPLPRNAHDYLPDVLPIVRSGGVVHLYHFAREDLIEESVTQTVREQLGKRAYTIEHIERVGQYAPGKFRICADIRV